MEILKFIWQLPQIAVAFTYFIYLYYTENILSTCTYQGTVVIIRKSGKGSVTLGDHIFLAPRISETLVRHEWGHTRQSLLLGPLYLIIIGVPSILWAATHKYIAPDKKYAWFFTEAWANRLAGIS